MSCVDNDPADFSMWILKLIICGSDKNSKNARLLLRIVIGFLVELLEYIVFIVDLLSCPKIDLTYMLLILLPILVGLLILTVFLKKYATDPSMESQRYFLAFKIWSSLVGLFLENGVVVLREHIDSTNWVHISLITLAGVDVIMDPIEILCFGCCASCKVHEDVYI